jgi:hypothetical protein
VEHLGDQPEEPAVGRPVVRGPVPVELRLLRLGQEVEAEAKIPPETARRRRERQSSPVLYGTAEHVHAGGLMAYAASVVESYRRGAGFVDMRP